MSEERRERWSYLIGAALSVGLTLLAFGAALSTGSTLLPLGVSKPGLSRTTALWIIALAAVLQILAQLRFFLHIDLSRQKREDLQLILFSLLLLSFMVGGTLWILGNLSQRMM